MTAISKAKLAAELGVTRQAVAGYVKRGMPVLPDGKLDREEALQWIERHIRAQAGAKGAGVRGAAAITGSTKVTQVDALAEQVRLTKARADRVEMDNARLRGGTEEEIARELANASALHSWWCFQRNMIGTLAQTLAIAAGRGDDTILMYKFCDYIRERDVLIVREIRDVIEKGQAGLLERVRSLSGDPWEDFVPTRKKRR